MMSKDNNEGRNVFLMPDRFYFSESMTEKQGDFY